MIRWIPNERLETCRLAFPFASVAVPIGVGPSRKVTVPIGTPLPGASAVTVTVKVIAWPMLGNGLSETRDTTALAFVTVRVPFTNVKSYGSGDG